MLRFRKLSGSLLVYLQKLAILLVMVTIAAVSVLTLKLLCIIFAGLLLGVLLYRITRGLERRTPLSYSALFRLVVVALSGCCIALGFLVIPRLGHQLNDLMSTLAAAVGDLQEPSERTGLDGRSQPNGPEARQSDSPQCRRGVFLRRRLLVAHRTPHRRIPGCFRRLLPGDRSESVPSRLSDAVSPKRRERVDQLLRDSLDTLWWWLLGRLVAMTIIGVATSIGLWLLGIPMAISLGFLAGAVSFVPTVGAVLAIIPALLVAFQQNPYSAVYVLGLYLAIQAVENNLLTPFVQQKAVSVPPVVLVISQMLMGLLVGIIGVAIATPLAALTLKLGRELYVEGILERQHAEAGEAEPATQ